MLTLQEIQAEMSNLIDWSLGTSTIVKIFQFSDFKEALYFVNKVGEVAEKHNHHPDIMINFNNVRLSLTTNAARSLTKIDFTVARDIDKIDMRKEENGEETKNTEQRADTGNIEKREEL